MAWNYKPKRGIVIGFVIATIFVSYGVQCVVKQKFISEAVSNFYIDKYYKIRYRGIPLSAYDERAKETGAWLYNPLAGWEVMATLGVLFIGIGVLFVYYKSKVLDLEGTVATYHRKTKDLEETIRDKNGILSALERESSNKTAEIGNLRKDVSQYKAVSDTASREIAKIKEQCQAALAAKEASCKTEIANIKDAFSEVILSTKKECKTQIEQIKKQYEILDKQVGDANTI